MLYPDRAARPHAKRTDVAEILFTIASIRSRILLTLMCFIQNGIAHHLYERDRNRVSPLCATAQDLFFRGKGPYRLCEQCLKKLWKSCERDEDS
jgi:hypothetical protein